MNVVAKFKERVQARELRRIGQSIRVIAKKLGVSRGTVSLWCADIELTEEQRAKLIEDDKRGGAVGRARAAISKKNERLQRLEGFMNKGRSMVGKLSKRDLFIAGIALYWAEGNKKNRRLLLSNSDPKLIKIWIKWLTECLGVLNEEICCQVGINQLHQYRINDVEKYWSELIGIPLSMFRKASFKKVMSSKVYENEREHFGTLNVITLRSTNLSYLMAGLIESLGNFEADT